MVHVKIILYCICLDNLLHTISVDWPETARMRNGMGATRTRRSTKSYMTSRSSPGCEETLESDRQL